LINDGGLVLADAQRRAESGPHEDGATAQRIVAGAPPPCSAGRLIMLASRASRRLAALTGPGSRFSCSSPEIAFRRVRVLWALAVCCERIAQRAGKPFLSKLCGTCLFPNRCGRSGGSAVHNDCILPCGFLIMPAAIRRAVLYIPAERYFYSACALLEQSRA
jgi:hypothetical protein